MDSPIFELDKKKSSDDYNKDLIRIEWQYEYGESQGI